MWRKIRYGVRSDKAKATPDANFDRHLSIRDDLFYNGLLHGIPRRELKKRVDAALQWSKLEKYRNKRFYKH